MKRYKRITDLGLDICLWDDTPELLDEVNIGQANRIAKIFLAYLNAYGILNLSEEFLALNIVQDSKLSGKVGLSTAKRISKLLLYKFRFHWFPLSLQRWKLSRILKYYNL